MKPRQREKKSRGNINDKPKMVNAPESLNNQVLFEEGGRIGFLDENRKFSAEKFIFC